MKQVCINPVFAALKGNFRAQDQHGHHTTLRMRETAWGTKSFGLGDNAKRNLTTHPLSDSEQQQRATFTEACQMRTKIFQSSTLRPLWDARFRNAVKDGSTSCHTLGGYIVSQFFAAAIDDTGNPIE